MHENSKIWWLTRFLLKSFMDNYDFYFLSGDLEEVYLNKKNKNGKVSAEIWLLIQILISLPPIVFDNLIWSITMFKSYLKIAYRNIVKNKVYSFINIFGLSVGLTCCLIIFLFVKYELSFDSFQPKADRIYRINTDTDAPDGLVKESCVPFPMVKAFRNDFPQAEAVSHIFYQSQSQIELDDEVFVQNNIIFADSSFLKIFEYDFVIGNPEEILKNPDAAILTESTASKLFGDESPIGKTFTINRQLEVKVAGIIKDYPRNTSFPTEMIVAIEALTEDFTGIQEDSWSTVHSSSIGFVLMPENVGLESIEQGMDEFVKKYFPERYADRKKFVFQPLTEIHTDIEYSTDSFTYVTSKESILIFSVIGLLTLIIASINFVNLSIAQSIKRAKEVGMRKVIGAHRGQLIRQFMGETFVYSLIAFIISILLTMMLLPYAGQYLGNNTQLNLFDDWTIVFYLLLVFGVVNILTGLYPSLVLSGFNPIEAFRNKIYGKRTGSFSLRNSLVIFQFVISQILILGTIIVSYQLEYVKNKDLGFNKDKIITVLLPNVETSKLKVYRDRLLQSPKISNVALSGGAPLSDMLIDTYFSKIPAAPDERYRVSLKPVDENYINTFNIKLLAGDNFRPYVEGDTSYKYIINETMMEKLGFTNPIDAVGQKFKFSRVTGEIIGVAEDFHTASLQSEIGSVVLSNMYERFFLEAQVKIKAQNEKDVVAFLESTWNDVFPGYNFDYNYFEEFINNLYSVEENFFDIMKIFAVLAIIIGCLGLVGLVSFVTVQKTKEIGVRKVLGASIADVLLIISKEFTKSVLVANLIAWPVAWYFMNEWLKDFAYRVEIQWWMFAAAGIAALFITIVTVSFQSVKAALTNPVNALKYE